MDLRQFSKKPGFYGSMDQHLAQLVDFFEAVDERVVEQLMLSAEDKDLFMRLASTDEWHDLFSAMARIALREIVLASIRKSDLEATSQEPSP